MLIKTLLLSLIFAACCYHFSYSQATFNGTGTFSSDGNWSSGSKPGTEADIILALEATMLLDENYTCNSLTIGIGASFSCVSNFALTVKEGIFDADGKRVIDIGSSIMIRSSIKIAQPYEIIINPTTNKKWLDRNLGASRVALSSNDDFAYGDLYQWGRLTDGHEKRTSGTTSTLSNSNNPGHGNFILAPLDPYDWRSPQNSSLWQGAGGINNPCPDGFRVPTEAEWIEEVASWSTSDPTGAFGSHLKLTVGGHRYYYFGTLQWGGYLGSYWSSSNGKYGRCLEFLPGYAGIGGKNKAYGSSVRCIKDTTPDR